MSSPQRYVKLVLAVGVHDPDYVDAYYGPPEWRAAAVTARRELAELDADAAELLAAIESERAAGNAPTSSMQLRHELSDDAGAIRCAPGSRCCAASASRSTPNRPRSMTPSRRRTRSRSSRDVLRELDQRLPGDGTLLERYEAFRDRFEIPKDRLAAVFAAAIDGCRARTLAHIALPPARASRSST